VERLLGARRTLPRIALPLSLPGRGPRGGGESQAARLRGGLAAAGSYIWNGRARRLALLALLATLVLLAGGWLWLRHSSLTSVQKVTIEGVHGAQAHAIEAALREGARGMSTLAVDAGRLHAAVARFHVVSAIAADPSFPHALRIRILEQLPVAAVVVAGLRTAVAADGVVLGPELLSSRLPTLSAYSAAPVGKRIARPNVLAALTVLGAAPAPLARRVERAYVTAEGLAIRMRNGLVVYFGDATRPHAKWLSLARVLADSSSAGASYVDVRLPARPAAGFGAATAAGAGGEGHASEAGTVAAIAEKLSTSSGVSAAAPATEPKAAAPEEASGTEATGAAGTPPAGHSETEG
jgi:cell division protein FtsQ